MKSIFRAEKNKGGVSTHVFAEIEKKDTFLVNRPLTDEELNELNEMIITKDNSLNSPQQEQTIQNTFIDNDSIDKGPVLKKIHHQ